MRGAPGPERGAVGAASPDGGLHRGRAPAGRSAGAACGASSLPRRRDGHGGAARGARVLGEQPVEERLHGGMEYSRAPRPRRARREKRCLQVRGGRLSTGFSTSVESLGRRRRPRAQIPAFVEKALSGALVAGPPAHGRRRPGRSSALTRVATSGNGKTAAKRACSASRLSGARMSRQLVAAKRLVHPRFEPVSASKRKLSTYSTGRSQAARGVLKRRTPGGRGASTSGRRSRVGPGV